MGLNSIVLRVLTQAPLTTKNAALNWSEIDTNFIEIYKALNTLINAVDGTLILQGGYACAGNPQYPTNADTILLDQPQKGYAWYVTTAGTLNGISVAAGAFFFAKIDNAGPTNDAQWVVVDSGFNLAALFNAWAMALPGYDNTKKRALTTVGAGLDAYEWSDFQQL